MASAGGGIATVIISRVAMKKIQIDMLIDGMLSSLVSTTAGCLFYTPGQALAIGAIGSAAALSAYPLTEYLQIDDPVGIIPVHVFGSFWGMIAPSIFLNKEYGLDSDQTTNGRQLNGLLYGGGFTLLGLQSLASVVIALWSAICCFVILYTLQHSPIGLRISMYEEELGADLREHGLSGMNIASYRVEKKITAQQLSAVLMTIVRWRMKARLGAQRQRRLTEIAAGAAVEGVEHRQEDGIEMRVIRRKPSTHQA